MRRIGYAIRLVSEVHTGKALAEEFIARHGQEHPSVLLPRPEKMGNDLVERLTGAGIPADKITAERFSSTPRYGFFGNKPSKYKVRNLVKITVTDGKDFQQIGKIVDQFSEVEG